MDAIRDRIDVDVAARLFHGLSDRTRLSILAALMDGERRVTDIVAAVGSSQSNVSNHLACLRECGLVVDRPGDRRQVFYSISRPEVRELLFAAERLLGEAGHRVRLCENPYMDQPPQADDR
ncbi:ArsR/SmtB family transcription factor [Ilumatobacter nonamiensis]|uniref:ArsR/SmtB family transcription factor n=1 Tax=Ilumatobacter nonamiensis TaxID=467093 RepID=UPI000349FACE|nr:metalloregulator ArsR/SmtB family transcription factor [Ilumatobacter nonamiensis]